MVKLPYPHDHEGWRHLTLDQLAELERRYAANEAGYDPADEERRADKRDDEIRRCT